MRFFLLLFVLTTACGPKPGRTQDTAAAPRRTVHVFVPPDAEAGGSRVPLLYLEEGSALFFPEGAGGDAPAVVPSPSDLVRLHQRQDIVIVAVDTERPGHPRRL